jgi:hypothetical protein
MSAVVVALVATGASASADVSQAVISSFRGQLVVSKDELPDGKNDKETISKIKAATLKELVGEKASDTTQWHFHYTAFLSKNGSSSLKLDFINDKGQLSANKELEGVDAKSNVLSGDITIDEDEGLNKGKTYSVEVMAGTTVVSKASVTFK